MRVPNDIHPGGHMTMMKRRTTVYLESALYHALRMQSSMTRQSMSGIVNDAVRSGITEAAEDLSLFDTRADERLISYDEVIRMMMIKGKI